MWGKQREFTPTGFSASLCRVPRLEKAICAGVRNSRGHPGGRGGAGCGALRRLSSRKPYRPWTKPRVAISGHVTGRRHAEGPSGVSFRQRQSWPHLPVIAWVQVGPAMRVARGCKAERPSQVELWRGAPIVIPALIGEICPGALLIVTSPLRLPGRPLEQFGKQPCCNPISVPHAIAESTKHLKTMNGTVTAMPMSPVTS